MNYLMGKAAIIQALLFLCIFACVNNEKKVIAELNKMEAVDQKWRNQLRKLDKYEQVNFKRSEIIKKMDSVDRSNFLKLQRIFAQYGFIDINRFGESPSRKFSLLVLHQDRHLDFQKKVLEKMKFHIENENASSENYAYLMDRVKINSGEKQVYGTQMTLNKTKTSFIPKPTIDTLNLNKRRLEVGLYPIEDYIKLMNSEYHALIK